MALFQSLDPTVIKEGSSSQERIEKLKEILPKASQPVQDVIKQDIALLEMGLVGENRIMFELKNSHVPMFILHDLFLRSGDLTAQIDYLVICHKYSYVIECKNLFGNIEINKNGDFIRTVQFGRQYKKEGIYSPITQNQRHLDLMRTLVLSSTTKNIVNKLLGDAFSTRYAPVVVLANDKTVLNDRYAPRSIRNRVIRSDQLVGYIKGSEAESKLVKYTVSDMRESAEFWLSNCVEETTDYIEKYRTLEREYRAKAKTEVKNNEPPICSKCGAQMVLRVAKTGDRKGSKFWGCPNYPKCRNIISIGE